MTLYPDQTKALLVAGGFAQVWDVHPERILGPPPFQAEGGFGRVAFSPDGRSVLIGSRDKVARLWDVATGHPLGPPPGHDRHGRVAVCPDGNNSSSAAWTAESPCGTCLLPSKVGPSAFVSGSRP